LVDYPETGWDNFFTNSLARATLVGTDLHVVWSAFLGGVIGYSLKFSNLWPRLAIGLGGFLLVVVTHSLQDKFGKLLSVLPIAMLEPLFVWLGATEDNMGGSCSR
jgi:predicted lysophospholipase L1 biosynthesis ABC-type transport system permease subunit